MTALQQVQSLLDLCHASRSSDALFFVTFACYRWTTRSPTPLLVHGVWQRTGLTFLKLLWLSRSGRDTETKVQPLQSQLKHTYTHFLTMCRHACSCASADIAWHHLCPTPQERYLHSPYIAFLKTNRLKVFAASCKPTDWVSHKTPHRQGADVRPRAPKWLLRGAINAPNHRKGVCILFT